MNKETMLLMIEKNMELAEFSEEAKDTLVCAYNHLIERDEEFKLFLSCINRYKENRLADFDKMFSEIKESGNRLCIHEYTMYMLLFLGMADSMRNHFDKASINREIFTLSLCDLKNHLNICLDLYGVFGHSVPSWHIGFLKTTTLSFGKLQFQISKFNNTARIGEVDLTPDSKVLFVHIPRTGEKLLHSEVEKAYDLGAEHFASEFGDEPIVFACYSWLLFPRNFDFLSKESNLRRFYDDFEIISVDNYPDYFETWRLFDMLYTGDPNDLPADTTLRRAYIEMIKNGESTGRALGAFVYER